MCKRRPFILLLTVLTITSFSCSEKPLTVDNMLTVLDSLELKLEWLDRRIALEEWSWHARGTSDSLTFYKELYRSVVLDEEAFQYLQSGGHLLTDEVDKRRYQILKALVVPAKVELNPEMVALADSLEAVHAGFQPIFDGSGKTADFLQRTLRTAGDRSRRELAFRTWCAAGDDLADGLERLLRMRNQLTQRLGYNNFLGLKFNALGLNIDEYRGLLRDLKAGSEPAYREILDEIKTSLNISQPEYWDLAFAYSAALGRVDAYFPPDERITQIKTGLKQVGFDLDKLPIYFDLGTPEEGPRPAQLFLTKPPFEQRIIGGVPGGVDDVRDLLGAIGRAIHFAHITQDRPLFVNHVDGPWVEGMSRVIVSLVDEPGWLRGHAFLPEPLIQEYVEARRKLEVISLRETLLQLSFELEAYLNPNRNLNQLWWNLFEDHMLLPRHDDIRAWATNLEYITHPVSLQDGLFGELIAAQVRAFLVENYDGVFDSDMTHSFLVQSCFRYGGRYDWRELLKLSTDGQLNTDYLISGFED